jgi:16S rRNA (guanine527-N7)-methyltransferase
VEHTATNRDFSHFIADICKRNSAPLDDRSLRLLGEFVGLVTEYNTKINLVSRADAANIWSAHVLHSLSLLFVLDIPAGSRVLDLGTGGGFPGVPLAIVRPDLAMVHIDSIAKKTAALREMIGKLGLSSEVVTGRAEEFGMDPRRRMKFDLVLARAVAPLADLIRWSRPLLKRPAHVPPDTLRDPRALPALVAMKGGDLAAEIAAARVKARPASITAIDLDFAGHREAGLEEKKILIVHP